MNKKDFISAANYYGITVKYSGKNNLFHLFKDGKHMTVGFHELKGTKKLIELMANKVDLHELKYQVGALSLMKGPESSNSDAPAGTPKTPPNGNGGRNNVILLILMLVSIVLYSMLVDWIVSMIFK